jgi:hypothetical protein
MVSSDARRLNGDAGVRGDSVMARRRYSTEIRGDGTTRIWTLHHRLRTPHPAVTLRDAHGRNVTVEAFYTGLSEDEVAVTFRSPPPIGKIYRVEVSV